jgi:hypothetical protein
MTISPFYWITETLRFGRICARKYPVAGWTLPTVVSFGLGLGFMEITNPTSTQATVNKKVTSPTLGKYKSVSIDPYDPKERRLQEEKRRNQHSTWQAQYVQDMLDGLKNKSTEEKLDDAFFALDQIFSGKK